MRQSFGVYSAAKLAAFFLLAIVAVHSCLAAESSARPNIVFVLSTLR